MRALVVLVLLLSGCQKSEVELEVEQLVKMEECKSFCAPYHWKFRVENQYSKEHGCTCSGEVP